jgi:hypothetical protein
MGQLKKNLPVVFKTLQLYLSQSVSGTACFFTRLVTFGPADEGQKQTLRQGDNHLVEITSTVPSSTKSTTANDDIIIVEEIKGN